jgi:hypothetical protein
MAIEALGGGRENAAIRKRLATIRASFPHPVGQNITDVYHDALEFLRSVLSLNNIFFWSLALMLVMKTRRLLRLCEASCLGFTSDPDQKWADRSLGSSPAEQDSCRFGRVRVRYYDHLHE